MDFTAFSHGQVHSKIWLCEQIEPYIPYQSNIAVLGSWYNLISLILLIRDDNKYQSFTGFDIDPDVITISNKLCDAYMIGDDIKITNKVCDVDHVNLNGYDVIINCSIEHMTTTKWFDNIKNGTVVCLQTSNVLIDDDIWKIKNPTKSLAEFKNKFPLSEIYFSGEKQFNYGSWGYDRYMLIGKK